MPGNFAEVAVAPWLKHGPVFIGSLHYMAAVLVLVRPHVFLLKELKHTLSINRKRPRQRQPPQGHVKPHEFRLHLAATHKLHALDAQQFKLKGKVGIGQQCLEILQSRASGFIRGTVCRCLLRGEIVTVLHGCHT